ncbi:hypothetical protein HORIV_51200 [Vreelandella olivaria]|uniref:EamA domain-containing protein n=1 Tax=Vreelandella olivaria TaxID=390919 RepID=A0ABM7GNU9_9GAMM|nr:hypothetical protein HORIV_51200 [Halomonas olivaria]
MHSKFNSLRHKNLSSAGLAAMPALFVLLWSTGFIGAKFGLPYAEPFTFLFIRFVLTLLLLIPLVVVMRIPWPSSPRLWTHIAISGFLVHGAYLGVSFMAFTWVCPPV